METERTFDWRALGTALVFGLVTTLAFPARSDDRELAKVKAEIEAQGLGWTAGETSISRLPDEVFRGMLMHLDAEQRAEQLASVFGGEPSPAFEATALPSWVPRPAPEDPAFTWRDVDGEDWTSPVRNQGMCGACTIFAAVGVIEGAANVGYGAAELDLDLAEQNLLSCTSVSCNGGGMDAAQGLNQAKADGVPDEGCHPYTATDGNCADACADFNDRMIMVSQWGWVAGGIFVKPTDQQIKEALSNGPLSTSMTVYSDFELYQEGVYAKTQGATQSGGHAVIIIGWNDEHDSWYAKNSWGPYWGDDGFFEIKRGEVGFADNMTAWAQVDTSQVPGMMAIAPEELIPVSLQFGSGNTYPRTVQIDFLGDEGELALVVDAGDLPAWLTVTPTSGTITPEQGLELEFLFDEAGWPLEGPGTQVEWVNVVAGHGLSRTVKATLNVFPPPGSDADADSDGDVDSDADTDDDGGTGADGGDSGCGCSSVGGAPAGLLVSLARTLF
ncbi:MAG TPA: C1 family peptidase [Polyangia bacterium]|nr:C1 family peptidase [Polyangia bacterium]